MSVSARIVRNVACAALVIILTGCGTLPTRNPIPEDLVQQAQLPGIPNARALVFGTTGDTLPDPMLAGAVQRAQSHDGPVTMLALSGGGARGAFGAGVLYGWSHTGERPEFDIVTGVSTGALISPFAFLGPDYDDLLHKSYTSMSDDDIYIRRGLMAILKQRDAVADNTPLKAYINDVVTDELLAAIANEHRRGRRLFVASTNMDAQMLSVWDMGAIAASGHPKAREYFCDILLASASIPVTFPPVYFTMEAGGREFDEMHCDGGVITQVFGAAFLAEVEQRSGKQHSRLYVIRNGVQTPEWEEVKPSILGIAARSTGTLIKTQSFGDMYRMYLVAVQRALEFHIAIIPSTFTRKPMSEFDKSYMQALFETGRELAMNGQAWQSMPPGYEPPIESK